MSRCGWLGALAGSLAVWGCGSPPGSVAPGGYQSGLYPFQVAAAAAPSDAAAAGLMPQGWKLDNFYGAPVPDRPKQGESYKTQVSFDDDGDGKKDGENEEYLFELRFESLSDDGVIWVRNIPVSQDLRQMQLPVLMTSFVESLAGGEYESVELEANRRVTVEKRYASMLVASQPCQLAGLECVLGTIELADVDQLKLSPQHRSRKLEVLIARTRFTYVSAMNGAYPVYLVAGYSNRPAQFDAGAPAFRDLLDRIVINKRHHLVLSPAAGKPTAPAPPTLTTEPPVVPAPP
jgi:hypothetical protein